MRILAIETSCDETAIALVEADGGLKAPKFKVLENLIASQIAIHRPFGGVVPNLAKREHNRNLPILFNKLVNSSKSKIKNQKSKLQFKNKNFFKDIDLLAVTVGPGLEPALWTGINFAKNLYTDLHGCEHGFTRIKLVGANHLSGHLYSFLLSAQNSKLKSKIFPAIALVISGGHTVLLLMKDLAHYKKFGETRDDAVGECFDKVARLLGLPYPGGPEIEKFAKLGNPKAVDFPRPMLNQKNYDFSFSGLKTSVFYYLRDKQPSFAEATADKQNTKYKIQNTKNKADIAASFQQAAFDVLIKKTLRAVEEFGAKSVMISGGVAANKSLQKEFKKALKFGTWNSKPKPKLFMTKFPTDNAAMIATGVYVDYLNKKRYKLVANGNLSL
ncbi:tRNA (adenosine(37)-N6)-threonylcarbamoyltransferase complex transferase subunit TsaD [Candidatus Wolfebacteria bacterium RBG_13_41_7]|uniref:tRNA N6-adenosine threonylcarbamoyltransferase n=1 Tax=Candidatus Wolfebacteria bacterium RBG_13_41_7 TaxID=1802554 RepID=A0A1F8DNQ8_9BACT|nr:MAG: tRNA (adenosine(37)-N6)-threonylcarbamoyltransferase complex transferase subunit TsaD [Candidatus Wolfebacteria bacterium RBG_13_41_7]